MIKEESLNKTWFIDIDGTIVKHLYNESIDEAIEQAGKESHLREKPLGESIKFLNSLPESDTVVLTTARDSKHEDHTVNMLNHYKIRYDKIIFDLRSGPRYLINDIKPVGVVGNDKPIKMAFAVNVERDEGITRSRLAEEEAA